MFNLNRATNILTQIQTTYLQRELSPSKNTLVEGNTFLPMARNIGKPQSTENPSPKKEESPKKKEAKKKDHDDDDHKGGGLLEPIIEDLKGWIERKRPVPNQTNSSGKEY